MIDFVITILTFSILVYGLYEMKIQKIVVPLIPIIIIIILVQQKIDNINTSSVYGLVFVCCMSYICDIIKYIKGDDDDQL